MMRWSYVEVSVMILLTAASAMASSDMPENSAGYSIAPTPTIAPWLASSRGIEWTVPMPSGLVSVIVVPRLTCAGWTRVGLPSIWAKELFISGCTPSALTSAYPMRWVKLTLPPRPRARWLLITMRLSASSLAGTARTLVAVGTDNESSMLLTIRAATPRRTVVFAPAGAAVTGAVLVAAGFPSPGVAGVVGAGAGAGAGAVVVVVPLAEGRAGAAAAGAAAAVSSAGL